MKGVKRGGKKDKRGRERGETQRYDSGRETKNEKGNGGEGEKVVEKVRHEKNGFVE